jgi:hypothetical protein
MTERKDFEMTDQQLKDLHAACRPIPYLVVGGVQPMSFKERIDNLWKVMGDSMGFDYKTAAPAQGKGEKWFSAVPK